MSTYRPWDSKVKRPENDRQGIITNIPLPPSEVGSIVHKRRQPTEINPEELSLPDECLSHVNSGFSRQGLKEATSKDQKVTSQ
ncbi:hypothetical protein BGZ96_007096 [Linnemannia gamsii]|uniref:Uncharacterized protein n=1 Tax=Linnemannia gamsii TaxID=64522 RepID=A0ABQ7K1E3_9FUNG|nr:hypothetical protein BGZ96_007096 [Linnemannia gamsii]